MRSYRGGQSAVLRYQRLVQLLGESDEQCVGGCEIVPQLPRSSTQRQTGEKLDRQIREILQGAVSSVLCERAAQCLASQGGEHLEHDQIGRRHLSLAGQDVSDLLSDAGTDQIVDGGGGVENRHSP